MSSAGSANILKPILPALDTSPMHSNQTPTDPKLLTDLVLELHKMNALCFGSFTLKSGIQSPIYIDLRLIICSPHTLQAVSKLIYLEMLRAYSSKEKFPFHLLCGVPYTALPVASVMSVDSGIPMVLRRKEGAKDYGRKREIEGTFQAGQKVLVIEDLITSGASIKETAASLQSAGLEVTDAVVLIDRQQGGRENLLASGIRVHSVINIHHMLDILLAHGRIDKDIVDKVKTFLAQNQTTDKTPTATPRPAADASSSSAAASHSISVTVSTPTSPPSYAAAAAAGASAPFVSPSSSSVSAPVLSAALRSKLSMSFSQRASLSKNGVSARVFALMERKKTNLCFSIDVTNSSEFFQLVEAVGPHIVILKTHMDTMKDFQWTVIERLEALAKKYDFIIFEDRKFADIGETVRQQYDSGIHRIVEWSHITNAHAIPGPKIIDGLYEAVKGKSLEGQRGLLLIAQMSSEGQLADSHYAKTVVNWAEKEQYRGFVMGFICQEAISEDPQLIHMTPGVQIPTNSGSSGDNLGQQYNSPHSVVSARGSDVIIVGRGIKNAKDPKVAAQQYQQEGWKAYEERIHKAK